MSDLEAFYIPKTLDAPTRWLFWSLDEAFAMIIPFGLGVIFNHAMIGLITSLVTFIAWRRIKGKNMFNTIMYMVYWYFPSKLLRLKKTPPSHHRIFLG